MILRTPTGSWRQKPTKRVNESRTFGAFEVLVVESAVFFGERSHNGNGKGSSSLELNDLQLFCSKQIEALSQRNCFGCQVPALSQKWLCAQCGSVLRCIPVWHVEFQPSTSNASVVVGQKGSGVQRKLVSGTKYITKTLFEQEKQELLVYNLH